MFERECMCVRKIERGGATHLVCHLERVCVCTCVKECVFWRVYLWQNHGATHPSCVPHTPTERECAFVYVREIVCFGESVCV